MWAVCSWIEMATPLWQKSGSLSLACAVIATCHSVGLECCALKYELNVCYSLCIPVLQLDQPFHLLILSWMYGHSLTLCTILWHGIPLVCCHLTPLSINTLNAELIPICPLLALFRDHQISTLAGKGIISTILHISSFVFYQFLMPKTAVVF